MLKAVEEFAGVPSEVLDSARNVDKHYIPTRYPNGFDSGMPRDYYSPEDSKRAIEHAEQIIRFCEGLLH